MHAVAAHLVIPVRATGQRPASCRKTSHVHRRGPGTRPGLGLDAALREQLGVEGVAHAAVNLLHQPPSDVRNDVVGHVVLPVLRHRRLERVPDARKPVRQGFLDRPPGLPDIPAALVVPHGRAARLPSFAFCAEATLACLASAPRERVRVDVETVGPGSAALVDAPLHAAGLSVSMNWRSRAVTT
jgi:hypothetical protein